MHPYPLNYIALLEVEINDGIITCKVSRKLKEQISHTEADSAANHPTTRNN